ncbi:hypothetical protein B0H11DRAFT_2062165 [Mycena galericulata]|nr:hypothetical protein B0H11DRAFT_2062165 [Mycena galericulata]
MSMRHAPSTALSVLVLFTLHITVARPRYLLFHHGVSHSVWASSALGRRLHCCDLNVGVYPILARVACAGMDRHGARGVRRSRVLASPDESKAGRIPVSYPALVTLPVRGVNFHGELSAHPHGGFKVILRE